MYATYGKSRQMHLVPSDFARDMWIDAVINYLESRIEFEMPNDTNGDDMQLTASNVGWPTEIISIFLYYTFPDYFFY